MKLYPGIRLTTEENHGKTSVGVESPVRAGGGEYKDVRRGRGKERALGEGEHAHA